MFKKGVLVALNVIHLQKLIFKKHSNKLITLNKSNFFKKYPETLSNKTNKKITSN